MEEMLGLFKQKFKMQEIFHIVKSLTYFKDANTETFDPDLFDKKVT